MLADNIVFHLIMAGVALVVTLFIMGFITIRIENKYENKCSWPDGTIKFVKYTAANPLIILYYEKYIKENGKYKLLLRENIDSHKKLDEIVVECMKTHKHVKCEVNFGD